MNKVLNYVKRINPNSYTFISRDWVTKLSLEVDNIGRLDLNDPEAIEKFAEERNITVDEIHGYIEDILDQNEKEEKEIEESAELAYEQLQVAVECAKEDDYEGMMDALKQVYREEWNWGDTPAFEELFYKADSDITDHLSEQL